MKIVSIIAEYNPLHKGHLYQLKQARERTSADAVVVLMSGNFVQRGEPAIIDKYTRTKMALSAGADAVLELPVSWATGSGERFADGAISILSRLNCVDILCYGCETPDSPLWGPLAELLIHETTEYQDLLNHYLRKGNSYPAARELVLSTLLPGSEELIRLPNNILALEYEKALLRHAKGKILSLPVKRIGSGYHDPEMGATDTFASATAIRQFLSSSFNEKGIRSTTELHRQMTDACVQMLTYEIWPDDLTPYMDHALLCQDPDIFTQYQDVTEDLSHRLKKLMREDRMDSFTELADRLKSRHITRTHINRALLHLILRQQISLPEPSAVRLLGFRKDSKVLRQIQNSTDIPVITRMSDAPDHVFDDDIRATHLYNRMVYRNHGIHIPDEFRHQPILY